jgi:hypothetical protein
MTLSSIALIIPLAVELVAIHAAITPTIAFPRSEAILPFCHSIRLSGSPSSRSFVLGPISPGNFNDTPHHTNEQTETETETRLRTTTLHDARRPCARLRPSTLLCDVPRRCPALDPLQGRPLTMLRPSTTLISRLTFGDGHRDGDEGAPRRSTARTHTQGDNAQVDVPLRPSATLRPSPSLPRRHSTTLN